MTACGRRFLEPALDAPRAAAPFERDGLAVDAVEPLLPAREAPRALRPRAWAALRTVVCGEGIIRGYEAELRLNADAMAACCVPVSTAGVEFPVVLELEADGVLRLVPTLMADLVLAVRKGGGAAVRVPWFRSRDAWLRCPPGGGQVAYPLTILEIGRRGVRLRTALKGEAAG